jgi:hypothetical protein
VKNFQLKNHLRHVRIKTIIIIVLKLNSGSFWGKVKVTCQVDPVNLSRCKNKNDYYYNFKTRFRGQPQVRPVSRVGLTIDIG